MRDAVHFRVAVFGAPGAAAAGGAPGADAGAGGAGEDAGGEGGRASGGRAAGPGVLVAALPAEEEVVAAELDILDAALELEAYVCNVHVRVPPAPLSGSKGAVASPGVHRAGGFFFFFFFFPPPGR